MNIRMRTFIIVALTAFILIGVMHVVAEGIMLDAILASEKKQVQQDIERFLESLSLVLSNLNETVSDWAAWDDAYTFIESNTTDFINSNLVDNTFVNLRLNLMLFVDSTGGLVFGKAFDLSNGTSLPLPQETIEEACSDYLVSFKNPEQAVSGLILLPEGPMFVASHPILTSLHEGPIRGALVIGRYLDSSELDSLSKILGLPLSAYQVHDPELPSDFEIARSSLSNTPTLSQPLNETSIAGYTLINDIYGSPILIARIDDNRHAYVMGQASLSYLIASLAVICVIFSSVILLLLEKYVLSRLRRLSRDVIKISLSGNTSKRVSLKGNDELSNLADKMNQMLEALQKSRSRLKEYSQGLEKKVDERTRELKDLQKQLLRSERLAAIGELAGMVGHDLRNPLTGIAGATYYLKTKASSKLNEKEEEMLDIIEKAIKHSDKIINDLLEYSKEIRLELEPSSPRSLVEETLRLVGIPERIRVVNLTEEKPKIKVDIVKIKRVLTNLIQNAVEAMPNGGTLTIKSRVSNNNFKIIFKDTGVGIPKKTLRKIWAPLFTTKAKGMGFGLSISKRIIEAHGGEVAAQSTLGKGATFIIAIPIRPKLEESEDMLVKVAETSLSTTTKGEHGVTPRQNK